MDGGRIELQYPHKDIVPTVEKLVERNQSFDIVIKSDFVRFAAVKRVVNVFETGDSPEIWKLPFDVAHLDDLAGCFALALHETEYVATSTETEEGVIVSFDISQT